MPRPEDAARADIDAALVAAGWVVQDRDAINLDAGPGVAVREFPLRTGSGFADYLRLKTFARTGLSRRVFSSFHRTSTRSWRSLSSCRGMSLSFDPGL